MSTPEPDVAATPYCAACSGHGTDEHDPDCPKGVWQRMDFAVRCLAFAVERPVWDDVNARWQALKAAGIDSGGSDTDG